MSLIARFAGFGCKVMWIRNWILLWLRMCLRIWFCAGNARGCVKK